VLSGIPDVINKVWSVPKLNVMASRRLDQSRDIRFASLPFTRLDRGELGGNRLDCISTRYHLVSSFTSPLESVERPPFSGQHGRPRQPRKPPRGRTLARRRDTVRLQRQLLPRLVRNIIAQIHKLSRPVWTLANMVSPTYTKVFVLRLLRLHSRPHSQHLAHTPRNRQRTRERRLSAAHASLLPELADR